MTQTVEKLICERPLSPADPTATQLSSTSLHYIMRWRATTELDKLFWPKSGPVKTGSTGPVAPPLLSGLYCFAGVIALLLFCCCLCHVGLSAFSYLPLFSNFTTALVYLALSSQFNHILPCHSVLPHSYHSSGAFNSSRWTMGCYTIIVPYCLYYCSHALCSLLCSIAFAVLPQLCATLQCVLRVTIGRLLSLARLAWH